MGVHRTRGREGHKLRPHHRQRLGFLHRQSPLAPRRTGAGHRVGIPPRRPPLRLTARRVKPARGRRTFHRSPIRNSRDQTRLQRQIASAPPSWATIATAGLPCDLSVTDSDACARVAASLAIPPTKRLGVFVTDSLAREASYLDCWPRASLATELFLLATATLYSRAYCDGLPMP